MVVVVVVRRKGVKMVVGLFFYVWSWCFISQVIHVLFSCFNIVKKISSLKEVFVFTLLNHVLTIITYKMYHLPLCYLIMYISLSIYVYLFSCR